MIAKKLADNRPSEALQIDGKTKTRKTDLLGLYGQVNKRTRWMPRQ